MTRRRTHLDATSPGAIMRWSLCRIPAVDTTPDRGAVTCRTCQAIMRRETASIPDYVHDGYFLEQTTRPLRQSSLTRRDVKLWQDVFEGLARIIADHDDRRAALPGPGTMFTSATHALAEDFRVRLDGYAPMSVHHPERLKRLTGALGGYTESSASVPRAARTAEKVVEVRRALETPLRRFSADCEGGADLVYELTVRRYVGSKGPAEICEDVERRHPGLTAKGVGRWTRGVFAEFSDTLMARGLIPTGRGTVLDPDDGEAVMAREDLTDADLFGWKAIASLLGVAEDTARGYADRVDDPLPVWVVFGRVEARTSEIREWRARQARPRHELRRKVGA